jgi:hypothetical protein
MISREQLLRRLATFSVVIGFAAGLAVPAVAHSASTYFPVKWTVDKVYGLGYLEPDLTTGTAHSSIYSGPAQWNAVAGAWLDFSFSGNINPMVTFTNSVCSQIGDVWVVSRDLSSLGRAGNTTNCGGSTLTKSMVQFHDGPAGYWYTGSSLTGPGPTQYDLRAVATHEFGHSMGFGPHFSSSDTVCTTSPRHTMCPNAIIGPSGTQLRSLEEHDKHTFAAAYP